MAEGPLRGIRVLEFSQIVAAPFAGVILSDLGADVIKAEPPGGDPHRASGAIVPQNGKRFQSLNRGKRSIVIDLRRPEGQALVRRIVPQFDVVTVNYRPAWRNAFASITRPLRPCTRRWSTARRAGSGTAVPWRSMPRWTTWPPRTPVFSSAMRRSTSTARPG